MSEFKVGADVEFLTGEKCGTVLMVGDSRAFVKSVHGKEIAVNLIDIRPIKSARDKAIDEMLEITDKSASTIIRTLYDAGYRKVKPLTREEFGRMLDNGHFGYYDTYDKLVKIGCIITE